MKNDTKHQLKSPLRFLNSYREEDFELFYGRNKEVNRIFTLFEKTNLVIVYGPSGSGKSSVALCGLTNRHYNWKPLLIRKNENIIDSFFEEIEVLFTKEDCLKLKALFLKISEITIGAKNNRSTKQTARAKAEAAAHRKELNETIEILFQDLKFIPFFIFDQFEELFIQGNRQEVEQFSVLLSLITSKVLLSNVVLCIQTEFFAHLLELERHNPNILDYKCHVDDPSKDDVAEIIRKTFESFEINQHTVDNKSSIELLTEEVKENRINLIIKKLGKNDQTNKVHLPFLQIYLNKLYIDDFVKTYPDEKELLLNPSEINFKEKPLEFTEDEIKNHGDIIDILVNYLSDVNTALISNTENKIQGEQHKHTVIKLLKHFVTEKNTKKSIEVESIDRSQPNYLIIKDPMLKRSITEDIWLDPRLDTDTSLIEMIDELINARILKENGNFIELSHNLLARVITKIPVDKDILDNYKHQFNTAYANYQQEKRDFQKEKIRYKKSQLTLLNPTWVKRIGRDIDYIIPVDEKDSERREFWKKSEFEVRKKRLVLTGLLIGSIILSILSGSLWRKSEIGKEKLEKKNGELVVEKDKLVLLNEISNVFDQSRTDRTVGYQSLLKIGKEMSKKNLKSEDFKLFRNTQLDFVASFIDKPLYFKKVLLDPTIADRHIISTKSRLLPKEQDKLLLFVETKNNLRSTVIDLSEKKEGAHEWKELNKTARNVKPAPLSTFKPYEKDSVFRVLYSNPSGLFENSSDFSDKQLISDDDITKNLSIIEHMYDEVFVAVDQSGRTLMKIDLAKPNNKKYSILRIPDYQLAIDDVETIAFRAKESPISFLKKASEDEICYLATVNSAPYLFKFNIQNRQVKDKFSLREIHKDLEIDRIKGFTLDRKHKIILIANEQVVFNLNLESFASTKSPSVPKINANHRGRINSISNHEHLVFIGTEDKKASIYYDNSFSTRGDEVISKTLIGHTDAIYNVSFRKADSILYGITSGEDGSINIWDLSPVSNGATQIKEARDPLTIKHYNDRLYAGFTFNNYLKSRGGYLLSFGEDLNESNATKHRLQRQKNSNITEFDIVLDTIFAGTDWNRSIHYVGTNRDSIAMKLDSRINDVVVQGNNIAVATKSGVYFGRKDKSDKMLKQKWKGIDFNSIDIHPSYHMIVATSNDRKIYLWDVTNDTYELYDHHTDKVRDARFSHSGENLVSGSWDNTAIVWKFNPSNSGKLELNDKVNKRYIPQTPYIRHNSDVEAVAINAENLIATASSDQTVSLHQLKKEKDGTYKLVKKLSLIRHDFPIRSVTFDKDGQYIYTADSKGHIKKWDYTNFKEEIEKRISH